MNMSGNDVPLFIRIGPANVEVADVEVAKYAAAVGVELEVITPEAFVVRIILRAIPESVVEPKAFVNAPVTLLYVRG